MTNHHHQRSVGKQSGAVLMTSLVFLLIMSMIVLAALRSGTLEERMAANATNRQIALQAAESVLRNAEVVLFKPGPGFLINDSINLDGAGFYPVTSPSNPMKWKSVDWSDTTATLTAGATLTGVDTQPRYIVEIIERPSRPNSTVPSCTSGLLGVTARGVGKDSAAVFVHAMYRYQSNRVADGC